MDKNLIFTGHQSQNWFWQRYYYSGANSRYHTFQIALNLLNQTTDNAYIVETGCQRMKEDLGAGMSTSIFAEYISRYGGKLRSIDIIDAHLSMAKSCIQQWNIDAEFACGDSLVELGKLTQSPDLLYLDSFDYPYGELLNLYGGRTDIQKAIATLNTMSDAEVIDKHSDVILPCQEHCLKEFQIAAGAVDLSRTVLLLDDNQLPGGGKPRLLKEELLKLGWVCVLDSQSSLWLYIVRP